jgi:hypothetical protein
MASFNTYQTVKRYEEALARHSQWIRWVSGIICPCIGGDSYQPDPQCSMCRGRGKIYKSPSKFQLLNETAKHDNLGRVYPSNTPCIPSTAKVYRKSVLLTLSGTQPADGSYIQLAAPYPEPWEVLTIDYEYDPDISITDENSVVYGTNILRTIAPLFVEKGKSFEGSIKSVSRVYNATKDETYAVSSFYKEYIYLSSMGTWVSGDVLEVDYIYQLPYSFMLTGIASKLRYEQPYVMDEADAILVTPYWAQVAPDDLFTAMAVEQTGNAIVDPSVTAGNDEIQSYYDLSRLLRVIDKNGVEYTVGSGNNVEIFERNELKWNVSKPSVPYTAQFTYHPTYIALTEIHTLRNSENKAFVNRVNVKKFDRLNERVEY